MRQATGRRRLATAALCAILVLCAVAPAARAEGPEPLFKLFASVAMEGQAGAPYPPGSGFEGPCGVAVDGNGAFYVADYYHHAIDAFRSTPRYLTQLALGAGAGPCGLAVDGSGNLYVNDYHRDVTRYAPAAFPLAAGTSYGPGTVIDAAHPTGVAVDPAGGTVYVDDRTYVAVYDSFGAPVEVEGHALHIGKGTLEDGYGLAFSQYGGTAGRLYVADAASDTVKVYDPALDTVAPVEEIDGHDLPLGAFTSLRDAALAVDRQSGLLYVADDLLPGGYERPEAAIYGFHADGSYAGRLSYNVVDALPPGLAVDNSSGASKGRVYVTSGHTEGALLYAYASGSVSSLPGSCAPDGACPGGNAEGAPPASGAVAPAGSTAEGGGEAAGPPAASASASEVVQKGDLRVKVSGRIAPHRLPRVGTAPIVVSVSGQISTADESRPPQLETLRIELNRHGRLDFAGLPTCPYDRIQPAASARALAACRAALVGRGNFSADVVLSGQEPYPTEGKLLVFNGRRAGKPVLFGHIYSPHPFATSFVIPFALGHIAHGAYGTALTAILPKALGSWGYLTGLQMHLARRFAYRGQRHSFLSAGCPAPTGFSKAIFPLARASFDFGPGKRLSSVLTGTCGVRG